MKRALLAFAFLLVGGASLHAQTVTVTGHLKSGNTSNVTSKSFLRFRLRNFSGNTPRVTGTGDVVQTQFDVSPDNTGTVTTLIYGNDFISPINTFWTVETWYNGVFQFSYNYGICAVTQKTYCATVGTTFNLDSAAPISFPTPPAPYLPLPGPTGPTGPAGPIGPQGPPGPAGGSGSGPALQTNSATNASQTLLNLKNGANIALTADGSGGVTVDTVGVPALSTDNPWTNNNRFKGPIPFADVTAFGPGANAISPTDESTTATCTGTSASVAIGSALNYQIGEGVTLQNCGPVWNGAGSAAPTVGAPIVIPSNASGPTRTHAVVASATGSSAYCYLLVGQDLYGALTAPSSPTCIANGLATIGLLTANVTGASRSNDTITLTTTTAATVGTLVQVGGSTPVPGTQFNGWYKIATNPGTTVTFTSTPLDTRAMPSSTLDQTSAATGGEISWFSGNAISWTAVSGVVEYWVCAERPGDGSYHVIGVSEPTNATTGYNVTQFEDWGATYLSNQTFPYWITDSICTGTGQNDPLTTTIASGAGTTSLVLAAGASNSSSGKKIVHDDAPRILAAANSVSGSVSPASEYGTLLLPPINQNTSRGRCYMVNSYLPLPSELHVLQAGAVCLAMNTLLPGSVTWDGSWSNSGTAQFAASGGAPITIQYTGASMMLQGVGNNLKNVGLTSLENATTLFIADNFNGHIDHVSFSTYGSNNNDTLGVDMIVRDTTNTINDVFITDSSFTGGPNQVGDASWTPLWIGEVPPAHNEEFWVHLERTNWSRRGMALVGQGNCAQLSSFWSYRQGGITPMWSFVGCGLNGGPYIFDHEREDTSGQPRIYNGAVGQTFYFNNITGGGNPATPMITGFRPYQYRVANDENLTHGASDSPNRSVDECNGYFYSVLNSPINTAAGAPSNESVCQFYETLVMGGGYSIVSTLLPPTSMTATGPSAGGSIPNGTYVYTAAAVDYRGAESLRQGTASTSVTTTTGNNTVAVGFTGSTGAISYNVYRASVTGNCVSGGPAYQCTWYKVGNTTTSSFSDTIASTAGNTPSEIGTAGASGMDNTAVWSPTIVFPEQSAPSGVGLVGMLYEDSTTHLPTFNANNVGAQTASRYTITPTNTDCVNWSGTTGLLGDVTGKCATYSITPTTGDCVTWAAGPKLGDAGAACGASGGGMNTDMSNMANPTNMSQTLTPASVNTIAVGTQAKPFTNVFLGTVANQAGSFDSSALTANHVIKFPNADATAVQNCPSVSHQFLTQILQSTGVCSQAQPTLADIAAGAAAAVLFNFSAATMEIPQGAGFTAASNSTIGIDTTAKSLHAWINAADSVVAAFASAPAGSKCVQSSGVTGLVTEAAGVCGTTTPSSSDTFTNKTYNAESTGNTLSEPVRAFFPAGGCNNSTAANGFDIGVTNAPTPQCVGSTVRKGVLQFARGNVAYLNWHLPPDWNSGASTDIEIAFTTTDTTNGHVTSFNIQTGCNAVDGTATDDPTLNSSQALSVTTGASQISGGELTGTLTAMTMTGCAANKNFEIAITRNNSGTDTNTDTAVAVKSAEIVTGVSKNAANR